MFMLTICGSLQWKDLGKAIGVDIEGATGKVSESDLETQFRWVSTHKDHAPSGVLHKFTCVLHDCYYVVAQIFSFTAGSFSLFLSSNTTHSHGIHR